MADGAQADTARRHDPMNAISFRLSDSGQGTRMSTGDRAALRRLRLKNGAPTTGVVVKLLLEAGVEPAAFEKNWPAWEMVAHVAALLSGTTRLRSHRSQRGFGAALRDAGYSENRLLRLTAAKGEALQDQVALAARYVAQSRKGPIDLWSVWQLVGRDTVKAEAARIRLARDFYDAPQPNEDNAK